MHKYFALFIATLAALVTPQQVLAQEASPSDLALHLDMAWLLISAALVLLMQLGFMFLEAGMVRSKNSVNVAQKNFLDLAVSIVLFAVIGFMFSFGASSGPIGWDSSFLVLRDLTDWEHGFFAFQVMFCGTAATIVSGAVAERMRLKAYLVCSALVAGLIYPAFTHWAWGGALMPNPGAFLANLGFVDFAGSTVVHATGAWVALAGCLVLGPRIGRFADNGTPRRIAGHSAVLTTAGTFLLFVGWIGFNGGSTLAATSAIAGIIANTVLAAGAGGLAGYLAGRWADGIVLPEKPICGMLGGLVAVTAGCHLLDGAGAMIIGAIGGIAAVGGNWLLEHRLRLDDAVGAIGVHGFAGVAGTLGLVFLARPGSFANDVPTQFAIQAFGVVLNFAWAFGLGLLAFAVMRKFVAIRPSKEEEEAGLNEAEHDTRLGIGHVESALGALASGQAGLDLRLPVTVGDDAETLTRVFNDFMNRIEAAEKVRGDARELARAQEEAERLSAMADAAFEGICITVDGAIHDANPALEKLLQFPLHELVAMSFSGIVAPRDLPTLEAAINRRDAQPVEVMMQASDKSFVPVEVRTREIVFRNRTMRLFAIVDLRERRKAEERIRYLAQHDTLTGLPNRAVFNEQLQLSIERASNGGLMSALLLVDLDRFKDVNDVHGHPAGDCVLEVSSRRLDELLDGRGIVARLGGDEFAVLLTNINFANEAAELAHRLIEVIGRPIGVGENLQVRVGASVGVAILPKDGADRSMALSSADVALYASKHNGRNTFSLFEPGMDAQLQIRRMLESDLENALEREQFELHFQPRIDVRRNMITSYEALLRWNHPERGNVSPADFIPIAERSGQIIAIGEWVLRQACRTAQQHFGGLAISVNVSTVQFRDKLFVDKVLAILQELDFPPHRLELEITESVMLEDEARATAIFAELKRHGVRLALDDFGTGYSSLSYLRSFPFDCIKMDRSFVQGLGTDSNAQAIADAVISLGKSLNLKIVAEGVEKQEELDMLTLGGCDEVQGYFTGRPTAVANLSQLRGTLPDPAADHLPKITA